MTWSFNLKNFEASASPQSIKDMLIASFIGLYTLTFPDPFIFSAERFGISLFLFMDQANLIFLSI